MADSALAKLPVPARIGISAGLMILFGLAYYVLFFSDIAGQIETTKATRLQLDSQLTAAKQAEQAYQKDLEDLARRRERERELNKILPSTTEYPAFLSAVQSVANATGVDLIAWSPQPEVKEQYYARVPMTIELEGRFHQVAKFFYGIGQSDRIMNMENITLSQPKVVDQDVHLSVRGLATAFRALDAEAATTAGQGRRAGGGG
jgi:type IV pilus assembly protein PilO